MGEAMSADLSIRTALDADREAVLALASSSLGWRGDDVDAAYYRWKHDENPFGPSAQWVAEDDGAIVGLRAFLRWEYDVDGVRTTAVRAVDTATHPSHQGRGIFTKLTLAALDSELALGTGFVFNTPNSQSGPGYLKMGWQTVGRVPIAARIRRPWSPVGGVRVAAEKWSLETSAGDDARDVLADERAVGELLATIPAGPGIRTARTPAFLRWRYGFPQLRYRVVLAGRDPSEGLCAFRLRRRGGAVEAAVCDVLVPGGDGRDAARLLRRVTKASGASYCVVMPGGLPAHGATRAAFVPAPRFGPTLMFRALNTTEPPPLEQWRVSLGDIELL
jgi:GNAT superfamily N-acetyltransferase